MSSTTPPVLAVRNLETWYGPVNAIKGVSLDVHRGDIVTVLGANGAGKTTLLRALIAAIPANERFGTLETDYELLTHLQPDDIVVGYFGFAGGVDPG